jgi:uncharacterized membrane protein
MTFSNGTDLSERMRTASAGQRVTSAMLGGAVAGAVVSLVTPPSAAILIGWDVAVVIYLVWVWIAVWRLDPGTTGRLAKREDPSSPVAELVVIGAGIAVLGAVGFALVRAGQATGGMKPFLVTLGLLSVVLSWTVVHTVYARAYYSEPVGGIEFNEEEPPTYTDFAYFAFTVGMTFQVADTNITSKAVRRITLHHALLSYLFGAVLLGLVINVVATLLKLRPPAGPLRRAARPPARAAAAGRPRPRPRPRCDWPRRCRGRSCPVPAPCRR